MFARPGMRQTVTPRAWRLSYAARGREGVVGATALTHHSRPSANTLVVRAALRDRDLRATVVRDRDQQRVDVERLPQVRRSIERLCAAREIMRAGNEDHRDVARGRIGELRPAELVAADIGHHEIEQDDAWAGLGSEERERGASAA